MHKYIGIYICSKATLGATLKTSERIAKSDRSLQLSSYSFAVFFLLDRETRNHKAINYYKTNTHCQKKARLQIYKQVSLPHPDVPPKRHVLPVTVLVRE